MLNRVKNWIGVEIRSGGIKRNPHIESPGEMGGCAYEESVNEFEFTYSLSK
jgi:formylmethanofuran dehydrogenase subunit C